MNIAYLHYHLKTGGVTTVMQHQIAAIRSRADVLVFTGEPSPVPFPADQQIIPALGYDRAGGSPKPSAQVADEIVAAIRSRWPDGATLLHVHNPTLVKNRHILDILKHLQQRKINLLLQIHDFAEDGRPAAFSPQDYPANCHYAVINRRAYQVLLKSGLKPEGLHLLPNMIDPQLFDSPRPLAAQHVLYPVRAIRRKNIGEALLLSLFFSEPLPLVFTLPPNSPSDIARYEAWQLFVANTCLNVAFDAGRDRRFDELVGAAAFMLTTSVTEGFGFSFLEPWLADKLLWGRRLDGVCRDFKQNGLDLSHLYKRLMIPLDWIDRNRLFAKLSAAAEKSCRCFNFPLKKQIIDRTINKTLNGDAVDFGRLDEPLQQAVIARLVDSEGDRRQLIRRNHFLRHPARVAEPNDLIRRNRQAVLDHYSPDRYGRRLFEIYRKAGSTPVTHAIDKKILFGEFFDLKSFSLLQWGPDAD